MSSQGTRNKEQQEAQRLYEEMLKLEGPKKYRVQYEAKKAALEAYKKENKEALAEVPGKPKAIAPPVVEPVLPVELEEPPVVEPAVEVEAEVKEAEEAE